MSRHRTLVGRLREVLTEKEFCDLAQFLIPDGEEANLGWDNHLIELIFVSAKKWYGLTSSGEDMPSEE